MFGLSHLCGERGHLEEMLEPCSALRAVVYVYSPCFMETIDSSLADLQMQKDVLPFDLIMGILKTVYWNWDWYYYYPSLPISVYPEKKKEGGGAFHIIRPPGCSSSCCSSFFFFFLKAWCVSSKGRLLRFLCPLAVFY